SARFTSATSASGWPRSRPFRLAPLARCKLQNAVGGNCVSVMAWWGPGGAGLRRGTRSLLRAVTPTHAATVALVAALLLGAVALVLWGMFAAHEPQWIPVGRPDEWFGGTQ
ncbi:MAG TPA: hypothetical protein PLA46_11890, partial [Phycicoccus sp.]|nr:hypothetical protein [Phycicoccus sp.]